MPRSTIEARVAKIEAEQGMGQETASSRYKAVDNTKLSEIAAQFPTVSLSVFRWERTGGMFSHSKLRKSLGFYPGVRATDLLDFSGWVQSNRLGGGGYEVDVFDPHGLVQGPQYSFRVDVPGSPLIPPRVSALEQEQAVHEATHVEKIAQQLIEAGVNPGAAYQQAQEIIRTSPAAAVALMGEEDNMAGTTKDPFENMMRLMMISAMQRNLERAPEPQRALGTDPTVRALEDKISRLETLLLEQRASAREDTLSMKLGELDRRLLELGARKQDGPSDIAVVLQSMGNALGGQKDQLSSILIQHQTQTVDLMKALMDRRGSDDGQAKVVTESLLAMMRGQIELVQARMQEPVVQAESMAKVLGTMGGMIQAMAQMQSGTQDPPHIRLLQEFVAEVPEILDRFAGKKSTRQLDRQDGETDLTTEDYAYLSDRRRQVQQLAEEQAAVRQAAALERAAQAQAQGPAPQVFPSQPPVVEKELAPPPVALQNPEEEAPVLPEEALAVSATLDLGEEMEQIIREDEEWVNLMILLIMPNAAPHVVGKRWAKKIHEDCTSGVVFPEVVERFLSEPETFAEALHEKLGWDVGRANIVVGGIRRYFREAKVDAVQVPGSSVEVA